MTDHAQPGGDLAECELAVLEVLCRFVGKAPAPVSSLLGEVCMQSLHGGPLILQNRNRFGRLYLTPEAYQDSRVRDSEFARFGGKLMLLASLRQWGYLSVFRGTGTARSPIEFFGSFFEKPQSAMGRYILNTRGDYSSDPDLIQDQSGKVIFRGVAFTGDLFELADQLADGLVFVSPRVESLRVDGLASVRNPMAAWGPSASARSSGLPHVAAEKPVDECPTPEHRSPASETPRGTGEPQPDLAAAHLSFLNVAAPKRYPTGLLVALVVLVALLAIALWSQPELREALQGVFRTDSPTSKDKEKPAIIPATPAASTGPVASGNSVPVHYGVDASRWNGDLLRDLNAISSPKIEFAYIRASWGQVADPDFSANWAGLARLGIVRGAYMFYLEGHDPAEQARTFLRIVGPSTTCQLPPVLDFEQLSFPARSKPLDPRVVQQNLLTALRTLEQGSGRVPAIYVSPAFAGEWLSDPAFSRYHLWVADWTNAKDPQVPALWAKSGFTFWQRSPGYSAAKPERLVLDLDLVRGKLEDLCR